MAEPRRTELTSAIRSAVRRKLLTWYDRNKRELPWRTRTDDPYAQWVAEVMLQQTRVETVLDYYERFLVQFPDVRALARASEAKVLRAWEGLGYYRRIHNLHAAAKLIAKEGGAIPGSADELRGLPGIGRYTSAAIASIAFGECAAAVDGNVSRVLARLLAIETDVRSGAGLARVESAARELMPAQRCGDFNQAWMDLGSAVCTPRSPRCDECPLRRECKARALRLIDRLPVRGEAIGVPAIFHLSLIARVNGRFLVRRRASERIWQGMWELPTLVVNGTGVAPAKFARSLGIEPSSRARRIGLIEHRLTHRLMRFDVRELEIAEHCAGSSNGNGRWVNDGQFERLAVPRAHRRIAALAGIGS